MSLRLFLKNTRPFAALPAEELDRLAEEADEIRAEEGDVIFHKGERSDQAFVVRSGRVRIQHHRDDGSVRTVCLVAPGEVFCCLPSLDGGPYPATALAAARSIVYRVPGPVFRDLMECYPRFSAAALQHFCGRLREAGCEGCGVSDSAPARLAGKLLAMSDKFGTELSLTRRELGELAGTTVETAIRVLKEYQRAGWVELRRGWIRVRNREALRAQARGINARVSAHVRVPKARASGD